MKPKPYFSSPIEATSIDRDADRSGADRTSKLQVLLEGMETFSYGISHDLRAPLRAITGFSNILIEEHSSALNSEGKEYLNRINAASRRMDELIGDVLNFNQTSKCDLVLGSVDPVSLIKEVITIYPGLDASLITITYDAAISPVLANEAALVQCISNILTNAAKFGAVGSKPEVIVSRACLQNQKVGKKNEA
jgi:signal transduction histidine kinase